MPIPYFILYKLLYIAAGIGGISGLIFFHELGHFLFCKLFNIATPSFSIGVGPELFSRTIGKTRFIIAAIPLGGYVEIAGMINDMDPTKAVDAPDKASSFIYKPFYQKLFVLLGGIIFNIIFAYAIFSVVHFVGTPASPLLYYETAIPVIKEIVGNSPAQKAGLLAGDRITAVDTIPLESTESPFTKLIPGQQKYYSFSIVRGTESLTINISPDETAKSLGIMFATQSRPGLPFIQAIKQGITTTNRWIYQTAKGLFHLFKQRDFSQTAGPIKIISMITQSASDGFIIYIVLLAIISINLALFNLLPAPILDGGQMLICLIEALFGRQLPLKAREYLFITTWLIFLILIVYLSFKDLGILRIIAARFNG
ncbi:MAG TPA: M50 family metallopeptidase [Candidatus Babeliales bacterium]|jgi:regulator of sigma E protease|nr:M50 family metallopeptidase [Candidatus Babeliales bacterium]